MREFEGKNVVIVGASSGLGEALVNTFVNEDANTYALSRTVESKNFDRSVKKMNVDISKSEEVSRTFDHIDNEVDAMDFVITTVGLGLVKAFSQVSDEEIDTLLQANLLGPMLVARAAYQKMLPYKKGHIVTVSSTTGLEGKPNEVVYSAVKQGIRGMNQALNKEAATNGIEAMCIFPGGMRSENFWRQALPGNDISEYMDPNDVGVKIVDMLRQDPPHPVEFTIRRPRVK